MLKKTIKFQDLEGKEVVEDFYFHMSIDDLASLDASYEGGFEKHLNEAMSRENVGELFGIFRDLIARAVGVRTANLRAFIKPKEFTAEFIGSDAYSVLLLDLLSNPTAAEAVEFFNGIMPAKLQEQIKQLGKGKVDLPISDAPQKPRTLDDYTMTELTNMPYEEFDRLLRSVPKGSLSKDHLQLAFQRRP